MYRYAMSSSFPACIAGFIAAAITLVLVACTLFVAFPPLVPSGAGFAPIDLRFICDVLHRAIEGDECFGTFDKFIGVDCRLAPISRLFATLRDARETRLEVIFAILAIALAGGGAFLDALFSTPLSETAETRRGRPITYGEYARRRIRKFIAAHGGSAADGLWLLPHVRLNRSQESRNILLLGGHGSGKTGWLRGLLEQLIARPGKVFVLDVKGDMIEGLPTDRFILVAAADLRTWVWNIGEDVVTPLQAAEFAAKIVEASERERIWPDAARAILADLIVYLQRMHGRSWGWPELSALVLSTPAEIKAALVGSAAPSAVLLRLGSDDEENRTVLSILMTLWVAALTQIRPLAEAWRDVPANRRFSIRKWVRKGSKLPTVMVFQKSAEYPELSSAIGAFIIDAISAFVLSPARRSAGVRRYAMVLDEFPELGVAAKRLPRLLSLGREAGVTTVATLQDLGQLKAYGETDASLIEARFGIRGVLALEDGDSARRVCETWIGTREIRKERERTQSELKDGVKKAHETTREPVIEPAAIVDDLSVFEKGGRLVTRGLLLGFGAVACVEVPLTIWEPKRPAFTPARWLNKD